MPITDAKKKNQYFDTTDVCILSVTRRNVWHVSCILYDKIIYRIPHRDTARMPCREGGPSPRTKGTTVTASTHIPAFTPRATEVPVAPDGLAPVPERRALVISDIHSNQVALDAVLRDARACGGFDEVWVLGDIVGYGPQPNEVIQCLRDLSAAGTVVTAVGGNHEHAVLGVCHPLGGMHSRASACADWNRAALTEASVAFLAVLPDMTEAGFRDGTPRFTLAHGAPCASASKHPRTGRRTPCRCRYDYSSDHGVLDRSMRVIGTPHLVVGHTHEPRITRFPRRRQRGGSADIQVRENGGYAFDSGRFVINPGSVGQPRDGDPRASYAVLGLPGSGSDAITVTHRRVAYDVAAIQSEMMRVRLPLEMATRLSYGE